MSARRMVRMEARRKTDERAEGGGATRGGRFITVGVGGDGTDSLRV